MSSLLGGYCIYIVPLVLCIFDIEIVLARETCFLGEQPLPFCVPRWLSLHCLNLILNSLHVFFLHVQVRYGVFCNLPNPYVVPALKSVKQRISQCLKSLCIWGGDCEHRIFPHFATYLPHFLLVPEVKVTEE